MSAFTRTLLLAIATSTGMWATNLYNTTASFGGSAMNYVCRATSGINNSGQFVVFCGIYVQGSGWTYQSFLYSGGDRSTVPTAIAAINNSGQMVGGGFLYSGGGTTSLGSSPGCGGAVATGINDNGQVAGYCYDSSGNKQAFLYTGGAMTGLGFLPGYIQSQATGIDNSGQVVGYSTNASGNTEAFLYSGGVMTGLGFLPGYIQSTATAINNSGQVVGGSQDSSGNWQAFLYSRGVMTGLGFLPGYSWSYANAINNSGQVVGDASSPGQSGAFLYSGGQMYDLGSLIADFFTAYLPSPAGINDAGQILLSGSGRVDLLTPLAVRFVPVTPCRVADTRTSPGPFGGPALDGVSARSFAIPQGACGIPATAGAYSINVTAVPQGPLSYLTLWPTGVEQPNVSTLNSFEGNVVANAAIVGAGQNGAVSVFALANNPTDVILDIDGYFDPIAGYFASTAGDSFYPVQPCRVADTRRPAGSLGGPALSTGETRDFPVPSSPCGLPATASAYSMNATVVPSGYLGFLTTWAAGQPQPFASTLNSWTGKVVANAAIVPAGANGATSVYVTNPTDVILDANGYFAPPGSPGALTFYPVVPCRVADTREADGGPILAAGTVRSFAIPESGCGIPSNAAAYALNITVVPDGPLGYLTVWPAGSPQPFVSTLNSWDGTVVANAAIVSAGTDGAISIYVTNQTHVILDINGYFAP